MVETVTIKSEETTSEKPQEEVKEEVTTTQERPEWLQEKFKSPEDLAKAYDSLQGEYTKLTQKQKAEEPKEQPTEKPKDDTLEIQGENAEEALESVGLDFGKYSNEYNTNGSLSDSSYAEMEQKGIPRNVVDQYIQGQQALATNVQNQVYNTVGGKEHYTEMVNWAKDSLSKDEVNAFNTAVNSSDVAQINLAVQGLNARYTSSEGTDPSLVGGKSAASTGVGYENWSQVTADMAKPEYRKDSAFQQEVQDKLARSKL
jgi:hypothetical protein